MFCVPQSVKTKETNPTRPGSPTPCKQALKLLVTHVVFILVSTDQMSCKSQSSVTNIYRTLKLPVTHVVFTLVSTDQLSYKSQSSVTIFIKLKTTSNSCCINLGLNGPDVLRVTIISGNIYQTLKLLVTHVVLTLVTLDQMVYKSQSSVTIFIKL